MRNNLLRKPRNALTLEIEDIITIKATDQYLTLLM